MRFVLVVGAMGMITLAAETYVHHSEQPPLIGATIPGAVNPPRTCSPANRIVSGPMAGECKFPPESDYGEQPPCRVRENPDKADRLEDEESKWRRLHERKFKEHTTVRCPGQLSSEWDGG